MSAPTQTAPLHLARLQLNPRSPEVHQDLRDRGAMHRRIQALFPDQLGDTPRAGTRTLFRLELTQTSGTVLIQSSIPINRNALPPGYTSSDIEYRDLAPLLDWAQTGYTVNYRIDANPVRAVIPTPTQPGQPRQRGRRTPLAGQDAIDWWERQAERAGLKTHLILDTAQPPATASRDAGRRVTLRAIRFEGVATITDPDALQAALRNGIGQGRAFGLGLLSIAPHQD